MRAVGDQENHADLGAAADRAGAIVTDQIRAMLEAAENRAREVRRAAENDARETRQAAAREAAALFKQLEAIERPLDALVSSVRGELDSLSTEFRRHWASDDVVVHAVPDPDPGSEPAPEPEASEPAPEPEPAPQPEPDFREEPDFQAEREEEEVAEVQSDEVQSEADEPEEAPHQPEESVDEPVDSTAEVTDVPYSNGSSAQPDAGKKRGLLGRLTRRKSTLFISTPGQCAVCYRSFAAGSEEALEASGWKVSGELGLCPQCQEDGWQLPEGARLPYRRAAT